MPTYRAKGLGDIPTPPRATTKLFDATCTFAGPLEKTSEVMGRTLAAAPGSPTA